MWLLLDRELRGTGHSRGGSRIQNVVRNAEMHRPGRTRLRLAPRSRDVVGERVGGSRKPGSLGDRRSHGGLVHFLECAFSQFGERRMSRDQHQRRLGCERRVKRADGVGVAGAAGDEGDAGLAGEPAPRVGHVHRGRLVAYVHELEARVERGVEHGHHVVPGEREEMLRARRDKRACQKVCAPQWRFHEA
jgi:hypothetical protein